MNLLMIATSLEMRNVGHSFEASTYVIQGHVLAMFGPSLISGLLIRWLRRDRFVALGMTLMALAALTALMAPALWAFIAALILVGLAWNFLFISSGSMVASLASPGEKLRAQGINDMLGSSFSAAGSVGGCGAGDFRLVRAADRRAHPAGAADRLRCAGPLRRHRAEPAGWSDQPLRPYIKGRIGEHVSEQGQVQEG